MPTAPIWTSVDTQAQPMPLEHTNVKRRTTEELGLLIAALVMGVTTAPAADRAGVVTSQSQGLHGCARVTGEMQREFVML